MLGAANMLEAQERLSAIMDGAASAGNLKKGDQRQHINRLRKMAGVNRRRARDVDPAQARMDLAQMGFQVVKAGGDGD